MSRFFVSSRSNPCPICSDSSGDCRFKDKLILCHSFIEQDAGIPGYKFAKTSSNGVWGVHFPDNGKQFDQEKYEQYLALKRQKEADKKQFYEDNALDANSRDRAIRKLAKYIGLDSRSRNDLKRRGLSDRQIEAGLFFSIDPWKRFDLNLPRNLPGIHFVGDRLATRDSGYACPIFDKQGRAISWQLRVEGVTKNNKYKWAVNSTLKNAELPITFIPSENSFKRLYLTEGFLKPLVAANKLNLSICGASSGHFAGSPEQFREIQSDYDEFVVCPDAGDIFNPQVMQRWEKQITFLRSFGKPIKILWWGQVDKNEHQDIDEIDSITLSKAEFLTTLEFIDLAKKQQYVKQQWDNWRNYKKFTPQIKINKRYIEYDLPLRNYMLFVKSGLGSGKTTQLIKLLGELHKHGVLNCGYRNTLLLQFNEKAKSLGFYHLQSDKSLKEFSLEDDEVKVSYCIDSLIHFAKEHFNNKVIILDEVVSVIKHLLYSSTIRQFAKVKELFREMIIRAERIICLDGCMADWVIQFFKELAPNKQAITIENTYQGNKPKTYLLEGTVDIDEKVKRNDKSAWLEKLFNSDRPAIGSDSQIFCEALDSLLIEQGRQGVRIDSKTISAKHIKEFFVNPNKYIEENQIDYLIYSPSAESGLDVSIKDYFTEQFSFFFGAIDTDSCMQMISRIRDSKVPRYVWCKQFIRSEDTTRRPSNVLDIQADRARSLMNELNSLAIASKDLDKEQIISRIQQTYQANLDPFSTAADTIKAIQNHEFSNYRQCFKTQLVHYGYQVESLILTSNELLNEAEKKAKVEVKEQNSTDIFNASDRYIGQSNINLNFDASWENRCEVLKAKLVNSLPNINHSNVWNPEFIKLIKYDKPSLVKQVEQYYLLNHPNLVHRLSIEKYNNIYKQNFISAPWKLRQDYLRIKALRDVGLDKFVYKVVSARGWEYTANDTEVKEILRKCSYRKNKQILGALGKHPIKFFNNLLRSLSIEVKSHRVRDENGDRYYKYLIDSKFLFSSQRLAILQAIQLKYAEKIKSIDEPLDWSLDAENSLKNTNEKTQDQKQPQTPTTHNLNPVPHDTVFYIKNNAKWDNHIELSITGNNTMENNTTNIIQNPLDSEEAIADLANYLMLVDSAEYLAEIQKIPEFTRARLQEASNLLPLSKRKQIYEFAVANRKNTA